MTAKQKLGPLQREWIRCLRSVEFQQGQNWLVSWDVDDAPKPGFPLLHCCLGVACCVAEANGVQLNWFTEPEDTAETYTIQDSTGSESNQELPRKVMGALKFHSKIGRFLSCPHQNKTNTLLVGGHSCVSLANANDQGCTFEEIADFVEDHPEEVFSGPA